MLQVVLGQKTTFELDWQLRSTPTLQPFSNHFQFEKTNSSFLVHGNGTHNEVDVTTVDGAGVRTHHAVSISNNFADGVAQLSGQRYDGSLVSASQGLGNSPFLGHLLES